MKTILYGPVTDAHLADAALFAGIEVSERITEKDYLVDPMVHGEPGVLQQHWRMAVRADALICVGYNEHMLKVAESCKLLVHQVEV